eukprot:CAMPEP_0178457390 /NCGR_PEP_ID=MMETSP0689_2-20121128/46990_1 /TAXON_ID=160604 /ORGANISM="Amphidinium massartii, Strain CS-259" /LENGTH=112 /DNA_ID=CAMNT_0020083635 /DNA_START=165 /DNA_END=500 /DNA_ORIENTATION=-
MLTCRVCYLDVFVEAQTARNMRDTIIRALAGRWDSVASEQWALFIDKARAIQDTGVEQRACRNEADKLWTALVDIECYRPDGRVTVVWCDCVTPGRGQVGTSNYMPPLPEGR